MSVAHRQGGLTVSRFCKPFGTARRSGLFVVMAVANDRTSPGPLRWRLDAAAEKGVGIERDGVFDHMEMGAAAGFVSQPVPAPIHGSRFAR